MAEALRWMPLNLSLRLLRRALLVLLMALVLVQTVGVLHRVVHAHGTHRMTAVEGMAALQSLWADHSNAVNCQLFDQSCSDALHVTIAMAQPVLFISDWPAATMHERFALFERSYAARGPPAWH
ncbi:hypothetical protein [Limnohabitans sp.]|uniref:hypothetical protein n=1 Tax=Limnohabitans sp. TaxID=1907725 RepID=UPI00286EE291|nr:hypothetical protein [Limnohabitans sp.]